jgi:hypothetical protein
MVLLLLLVLLAMVVVVMATVGALWSPLLPFSCSPL